MICTSLEDIGLLEHVSQKWRPSSEFNYFSTPTYYYFSIDFIQTMSNSATFHFVQLVRVSWLLVVWFSSHHMLHAEPFTYVFLRDVFEPKNTWTLRTGTFLIVLLREGQLRQYGVRLCCCQWEGRGYILSAFFSTWNGCITSWWNGWEVRSALHHKVRMK